jgi:hypothetical protein
MIARWVSIVFHPFAMVSVMVGVVAAARQASGGAAASVALVVLFTIAPLGVLMWHQVRRGRWKNADASNRAERPALYLAGGLALIALLASLLAMAPQSFMVRGVIATFAMLAVCAAVTRWIKVSLHMAFATLAAITLAFMRSPVGYALVLALPAIAWSRFTLQRHTSLELALGTMIGASAGMALHWL